MSMLIVIPCLNEAVTLPGLLAQQLAETDATIVVADGGSDDGSRELIALLAAQHHRLVLLDNAARLQSSGINLAVQRHGDGVRWLVRIDAHCDYPAGYARRLVETAEARDATSVVVPMVSRGTRCFQIAAATAQNSRLGTGGSPHRHVGTGGFVDHGHHALMDLTSFRAVGGYRTDMAANEDAELDKRLIAAGARIWLEPMLAVTYFPRSSIGALWRQYWRYGEGRIRTLRLHRSRPRLRQTLPLMVPSAVLLSVATPVSTVFALPLLAWLILCVGAGAVIGVRERYRCAMLSGVPAMTMHLAWGLGFLKGMLTGIK